MSFPLENMVEYPHISSVKIFSPKGPYFTKSRGILFMQGALPFQEFSDFFQYDQKELDLLPKDIRGFRCYSVRELPFGSLGGMEFHRCRKEIIFVLEGRIEFELEDLYGNKRTEKLTQNNGIYFLSFMLHTYTSQIKNSSLFVIANTLFDPDDSRTHDTYSSGDFRRLQEEIRLRRLDNIFRNYI